VDADIDLLLWRTAALMIEEFPEFINEAFEGTIAGKLEAGDNEAAEWWRCAQDRAEVILVQPNPQLIVANFLEMSDAMQKDLEARYVTRICKAPPVSQRG
jgi:hypothetical protein